ncbi:hypothetical protein R50072_03050 [Simiduia litorea]
MNEIKLLIAFAVFSLGLPCFAAVGSGDFSILKVEATDTFFTLYPTSGSVQNDGCEDGSKVVFWRTDFPTGYDSALSIALAAHMGNRKVSMWLDSCKVGPWGKRLPIPRSIVVIGN